MLLLEDVKVGIPKPVMGYVGGKTVEIDPYENFVELLSDKKTDWQTGVVTQSLFCVTGNINSSDCYHKNYISYLKRCWADHLGVIFTPDILWYSLLCELAIIVKANEEEYRHLFTKSKEKQDIIINTDEMTTMPLDILVNKLKSYVPTDADNFVVEFSTSNIRSNHAFHAAFCDMCSPYYNYMMLACGIPFIDVKGEKADYIKIKETWNNLTNLFNEKEWMNEVSKILDSIVDNFNNRAFWQQMFVMEKCGSGSQTEVSGWWGDLFRNKPRLCFVENYSSHVSKVKYKNLNSNKNYLMQSGLLSSNFRNDMLVPEFGYLVYEKR